MALTIPFRIEGRIFTTCSCSADGEPLCWLGYRTWGVALLSHALDLTKFFSSSLAFQVSVLARSI